MLKPIFVIKIQEHELSGIYVLFEANLEVQGYNKHKHEGKISIIINTC